jgi:5S rRNA maturation endonuclease (ribonuclease M5)
MMDSSSPEAAKLSESVKESVRVWEVADFQGLACGPDVETSDEIILVEGRADVINLLKNGIKNAIAIEGSKIPPPVIDLIKEKTTTAFVDGDRGGELDLKKLLAVADIDFVARAEKGYEVEELTKKQIYKALRERMQAGQFVEKGFRVKKMEEEQEPEKEPPALDARIKETLANFLEDLIGTRAAYLVDRDMQVVSKVPLSEIAEVLGDYSGIAAIIFDGKINQEIVDLAAQRNERYVVGMGFKEHVDDNGLVVLALKDLR